MIKGNHLLIDSGKGLSEYLPFITFLIGLFFSVLFEWAKPLLNRRRIRKGIKSELELIKFKLMVIGSQISYVIKENDFDYANRIRKYFASSINSEQFKPLKKDLPALFNLSDEENFQSTFLTWALNVEIREIPINNLITPFIDSNINSFSTFKEKYRTQIFNFIHEFYDFNILLKESFKDLTVPLSMIKQTYAPIIHGDLEKKCSSILIKIFLILDIIDSFNSTFF